LLRFYLLHVLLVPALLFVFTGVHYYKVIVHAHSLPPKSENIGEDTAKRVPLDKRVYFIPDILTSEIMWLGVTTLIMVILVTWFYHAPLETHANPQVTPLGTTAPWYFLWIQGALKLGDKVFWGVVFPGIVFNGLMLIPYIDTPASRRFADRRVMISIGLLLMSATVILSYMGLPEFGVKVTPDQEILHEMTMPPAHNHMGALLPVPYAQLPVGIYTTQQISEDEREGIEGIVAFNEELETGVGEQIKSYLETTDHLHLPGEGLAAAAIPADAPRLYEAMEDFEHAINSFEGSIPGAEGLVIVTQTQANLKRIDVVLLWPNPAAPAEAAVEATVEATVEAEATESAETTPAIPAYLIATRHIFIHEDAEYFAAPGA
jgi:hypothetical protein